MHHHVAEASSEGRSVDCSEGLVIDCRCGEKLLLLGRESDWRSEGRTAFECGGCGKTLSLEDGR
jgi:DNA-directed RNA polymerase subunit RPC12/RpoP